MGSFILVHACTWGAAQVSAGVKRIHHHFLLQHPILAAKTLLSQGKVFVPQKKLFLIILLKFSDERVPFIQLDWIAHPDAHASGSEEGAPSV